MKVLSQKLLEEIKKRLVCEFQPEKIIIFGSHAYGNPSEDSDLDLLVIVSDSDLSVHQRAVRAHLCLSGMGVPKDILVKTRSEIEKAKEVYASLISQILDKGRIIYG